MLSMGQTMVRSLKRGISFYYAINIHTKCADKTDTRNVLMKL